MQIEHGLRTHFETYCGKSRHFCISITPIARTLQLVTCSECKKNPEFILEMKKINKEHIAFTK